LRRRIDAYGRLENSSSGLPATVVKFSGTPVAGQLAVWSGAGTVFGTATFGTAGLFMLSGDQTASGVKTFSGTVNSGTVETTLIKARNSSGVTFQDDGGNLGISIEDGGQVGVKTVTPLGNLHGYATNFTDTVLVERGGQTTDSTFSSMRLLATKTSNMGDGFGPMFAFVIQDDGAVLNSIGAIGAVRAGGDTTGDLVFQPVSAGGFNERMRITSDGSVGMGVASPQGRLHAHDGTGGMIFVTKTGVDSTPVVVIPAGTGDIVYGMNIIGVIRHSDGSMSSVFNVRVNAGASTTLAVGAGTFQWSVSAGGELTVNRSGGSGTFMCSFLVIWL
jgi:hypothetical protein